MKREILIDIKMFLEQQKKMYEMARNDNKANFAHRQGIKLLEKKLNKVLEEVKKELE